MGEGKLFTDCMIKVENILRLENGLIIKKIGKVNEEKLQASISCLNKILKNI